MLGSAGDSQTRIDFKIIAFANGDVCCAQELLAIVVANFCKVISPEKILLAYQVFIGANFSRGAIYAARM